MMGNFESGNNEYFEEFSGVGGIFLSVAWDFLVHFLIENWAI
jgi:hypothetical protein